jgi:hypothetical protein
VTAVRSLIDVDGQSLEAGLGLSGGVIAVGRAADEHFDLAHRRTRAAPNAHVPDIAFPPQSQMFLGASFIFFIFANCECAVFSFVVDCVRKLMFQSDASRASERVRACMARVTRTANNGNEAGRGTHHPPQPACMHAHESPASAVVEVVREPLEALRRLAVVDWVRGGAEQHDVGDREQELLLRCHILLVAAPGFPIALPL